ncbi:hypothetical protein [Chitinophaga pinensis]|uniref:Uncharacterized protein n=1 Tax=Chitinophaga pinensis (strain ATCC 43595 / DSM 2588 / LMG 13176 / NBRC 15968 / NCIMB 11800 / UQM 2034) TaxID=485918 RepID=A0A979G4B4_CHIPD|nr:hypothetical protein [Chitinophaga pinensis]ACU60413.1 hypothetical protein Cpin_2934 [Chitinophaga pinensis DSM 2588]
MPNNIELFNDLKLKDGCMVGYLTLPDSVKVIAELDLEEEDTSDQSDFTELILSAGDWANGLSATTIARLKKDIARELTDAAYGESDYQPSKEDYASLESSLDIVHLCFYPDNVVVMIFEAKKQYPDMKIYCQLDDSYQLEDISVEK